MAIRLLTGDCRELLPTLPAASVHCVVTSPPYYGLRDYGTARWEGGDPACDHADNGPTAEHAANRRRAAERGYQGHGGWEGRSSRHRWRLRCRCGARRVDRQIGLEATPQDWIDSMVDVFRAVRRVLRADATVWLNVGDGYTTSGGAQGAAAMKPKDLLMMPARLALALQADGWWLRSDIIWSKPDAMPESCTDRPTSAHEHIFLLSQRSRYFYDADAVREPGAEPERERHERIGGANGHTVRHGMQGMIGASETRNRRNVWTVPKEAYRDAHFATMPSAIAELCIKAGCPAHGTVLDPFCGVGTTLLVADRLQRDAVGIELSPAYVGMARDRLYGDAPLLMRLIDEAPGRPGEFAGMETAVDADG